MNESEPRRVKIELRSGHGGETSVLVYKGMLYSKRNALYIKYEDAGEGGGSSVTVKWDGAGMTLLRHGDVQGEQTFRLGRRTAGWHASPAGRLRLEMETTALSLRSETPGGLPLEIEWQYELWIDEISADRFDLRLRVQEDHEE